MECPWGLTPLSCWSVPRAITPKATRCTRCWELRMVEWSGSEAGLEYAIFDFLTVEVCVVREDSEACGVRVRVRVDTSVDKTLTRCLYLSGPRSS